MRDEGIYLDGRKMKYPPKFFLGAGTSPFASDPVLQAIRDQKKVNAGAQFFQTNIIFDPAGVELWLEELYKRDVLNKVFILVGVAPLKSSKVALYLHEKVPGVRLPENILKRMEKAGDNAPEEGVQITLEIIDRVKNMKGVNGIHLMTLGWESIVQRIVTESNFNASLSGAINCQTPSGIDPLIPGADSTIFKTAFKSVRTDSPAGKTDSATIKDQPPPPLKEL